MSYPDGSLGQAKILLFLDTYFPSWSALVSSIRDGEEHHVGITLIASFYVNET